MITLERFKGDLSVFISALNDGWSIAIAAKKAGTSGAAVYRYAKFNQDWASAIAEYSKRKRAEIRFYRN